MAGPADEQSPEQASPQAGRQSTSSSQPDPQPASMSSGGSASTAMLLAPVLLATLGAALGALLPPVPLVYPFGGTLKLLMGHALPIAIPGRLLSYSQNLQFQFPLPTNASVFGEYLTPRSATRRRRSTELLRERALFYGLLQHQIQRFGGPGEECVKRSICESAETPLSEQGLVGEILQLLLTPDHGVAAGSADEQHLSAAATGRRGLGGCHAAYNCPRGFGLLDHISRLLPADRQPRTK